MRLSSADLAALELAAVDMFAPVARLDRAGWIAIVSRVPNRRANAVYPLEPPSPGWEETLAFLESHGVGARCKVPDWAESDAAGVLAERGLEPEYGADVMAAPIVVSGRDTERADVVIGDEIDAPWMAVHPDAIPPGSYGASGTSLVTARLGVESVGLAVVMPPWVGLAAMYTVPGARSRGLGRRVLRELLRSSALRGAERVFLQVHRHNRAAQRLYRRAGFKTIGSYSYWT